MNPMSVLLASTATLLMGCAGEKIYPGGQLKPAGSEAAAASGGTAGPGPGPGPEGKDSKSRSGSADKSGPANPANEGKSDGHNNPGKGDGPSGGPGGPGEGRP